MGRKAYGTHFYGVTFRTGSSNPIEPVIDKKNISRASELTVTLLQTVLFRMFLVISDIYKNFHSQPDGRGLRIKHRSTQQDILHQILLFFPQGQVYQFEYVL